MELHPIHLEKDGKRLWVILPHDEYKALCEAYDDALDLVALLEARIEDAGKPTYTLDEIKQRYRLGAGRKFLRRRGAQRRKSGP